MATTRTALVTGAGTGIGAAVARRLAADGFSLVLSGRRPEPLAATAETVRGLGAGVVVVAGDAATTAGAQAAVEGARATFGGLDLLVYNAGISRGGTALEQTPEGWDEVLRVNVTGAFLTARVALPDLLERRGAIVTVASSSALRASAASVAYCSSKAALLMLTRCLALDHGPAGLRANCVCPGWVETEMADRSMDALGEALGVDRAGAYAAATASVPARRAATPDEVAEVVAWLAGPGSSYVNGVAVPVDGGAAVVDVATTAFGPN